MYFLAGAAQRERGVQRSSTLCSLRIKTTIAGDHRMYQKLSKLIRKIVALKCKNILLLLLRKKSDHQQTFPGSQSSKVSVSNYCSKQQRTTHRGAMIARMRLFEGQAEEKRRGRGDGCWPVCSGLCAVSVCTHCSEPLTSPLCALGDVRAGGGRW